MCDLAKGCKSESEFVVVHKQVGAMPERRINACKAHAEKIGSAFAQWNVTQMAEMENRFYRIEKLA